MVTGHIDDSISFRRSITQGVVEGGKGFDVCIGEGGRCVLVGIQGASVVRFDVEDMVRESLELLRREGKALSPIWINMNRTDRTYTLIAHIKLPGDRAVQYRMIGLLPETKDEEIRLIDDFANIAKKNGHTDFQILRRRLSTNQRMLRLMECFKQRVSQAEARKRIFKLTDGEKLAILSNKSLNASLDHDYYQEMQRLWFRVMGPEDYKNVFYDEPLPREPLYDLWKGK